MGFSRVWWKRSEREISKRKTSKKEKENFHIWIFSLSFFDVFRQSLLRHSYEISLHEQVSVSPIFNWSHRTKPMDNDESEELESRVHFHPNPSFLPDDSSWK